MTKKEFWHIYSSEFNKFKKCNKCNKLHDAVLVIKLYYDFLEVNELYGENTIRRNETIYICEKCFVGE